MQSGQYMAPSFLPRGNFQSSDLPNGGNWDGNRSEPIPIPTSTGRILDLLIPGVEFTPRVSIFHVLHPLTDVRQESTRSVIGSEILSVHTVTGY